jgi:hypothetical protein
MSPWRARRAQGVGWQALAPCRTRGPGRARESDSTWRYGLSAVIFLSRMGPLSLAVPVTVMKVAPGALSSPDPESNSRTLLPTVGVRVPVSVSTMPRRRVVSAGRDQRSSSPPTSPSPVPWRGVRPQREPRRRWGGPLSGGSRRSPTRTPADAAPAPEHRCLADNRLP